MNSSSRLQQALVVMLALAALGTVTVVGKSVFGLNATAMALLYLLVVLAVSAFTNVYGGVATAILSGLLMELTCDAGATARCLMLKSQGDTIGALVFSGSELPEELEAALSALVTHLFTLDRSAPPG